MSWRVEVKPTAENQYLRLDRKTRVRIREALQALENVPDPLTEPRGRALTGKLQGDYGLRVGTMENPFHTGPVQDGPAGLRSPFPRERSQVDPRLCK